MSDEPTRCISECGGEGKCPHMPPLRPSTDWGAIMKALKNHDCTSCTQHLPKGET